LNEWFVDRQANGHAGASSGLLMDRAVPCNQVGDAAITLRFTAPFYPFRQAMQSELAQM